MAAAIDRLLRRGYSLRSLILNLAGSLFQVVDLPLQSIECFRLFMQLNLLLLNRVLELLEKLGVYPNGLSVRMVDAIQHRHSQRRTEEQERVVVLALRAFHNADNRAVSSRRKSILTWEHLAKLPTTKYPTRILAYSEAIF